jgi:hypothetical protein
MGEQRPTIASQIAAIVPPRIVTVVSDTTDSREYCVNVEISNLPGVTILASTRSLKRVCTEVRLNEQAYEILRGIMAVRGVEQCTILAYRLHVEKSPAIKWDEGLEAAILDVIARLVYPQHQPGAVEYCQESDYGDEPA